MDCILLDKNIQFTIPLGKWKISCYNSIIQILYFVKWKLLIFIKHENCISPLVNCIFLSNRMQISAHLLHFSATGVLRPHLNKTVPRVAFYWQKNTKCQQGKWKFSCYEIIHENERRVIHKNTTFEKGYSDCIILSIECKYPSQWYGFIQMGS